jgi:hypothetical protein
MPPSQLILCSGCCGRCVTTFYAPLDVTPSLCVYGTLNRESLFTHAKGPRRASDDRLIHVNAYGFAQWYASRGLLEPRMAKEFHRITALRRTPALASTISS